MAESYVGQEAGAVADQAKSAVRNLADRQKARVADRIGGVAQALEQTARSMEGQDSTVGRYTAQVAEQVGRFSQSLKTREIDDLWADTEAFARRQPLLFIGGAMVAGFVLARMIKTGDRGAASQAASDLADEARDVARRTGDTVGDVGQRLTRDAAQAAGETAETAGQQVQH